MSELYIQCGSGLGIESILKLLVRDSNCEPYSTCEDESIESIIKRLVSQTDDGLLALNICGCPEAPEIILQYQSIVVPWNQFVFMEAPETEKFKTLISINDGLSITTPAGVICENVEQYTFSIVLPKEIIQSANVIIIPVIHWTSINEGDIVAVGTIEYSFANRDGVWNFSKFLVNISETAHGVNKHKISTGTPKDIGNANIHGVMNCNFYMNFTTATGSSYAISALEFIFLHDATIGSDGVITKT